MPTSGNVKYIRRKYPNLSEIEKKKLIAIVKDHYFLYQTTLPAHWKLLNQDYMKYFLLNHLLSGDKKGIIDVEKYIGWYIPNTKI